LMHQNRIRNMRGIPGDAETAYRMLQIWRREKLEKLDRIEQLTAHLPEDDQITVTRLRSPQYLMKWLKRYGLPLPNLQNNTIQLVLDEYSEFMQDDDDNDDGDA